MIRGCVIINGTLFFLFFLLNKVSVTRLIMHVVGFVMKLVSRK